MFMSSHCLIYMYVYVMFIVLYTCMCIGWSLSKKHVSTYVHTCLCDVHCLVYMYVYEMFFVLYKCMSMRCSSSNIHVSYEIFIV